jgi:hypothetical protein
MGVQQELVNVTTDGAENATAYTNVEYSGRLITVIFTDTDLADTADITITSEKTGQSIWSESDVANSKTVSPRQTTHDIAGDDSIITAGNEVRDYISLVAERIKIVIAQGGVAKSGSFRFIVEN